MYNNNNIIENPTTKNFLSLLCLTYGIKHFLAYNPANPIHCLLDEIFKDYNYTLCKPFFKTLMYMLTFGCRISEVKKIFIQNEKPGFSINIIEEKTKKIRQIQIQYELYQEHYQYYFEADNIYLMNEKEFNRRFFKYCPAMYIYSSTTIKSKSHLCRHLFITILIEYFHLTPAQMAGIIMHSNQKITKDYVLII